MRLDLLSLTDDDLADISNRGNVKRATKELDRRTYEYTIETVNNDVIVEWSDEIRCVLAAEALLTDAECNCPATGVCRHIIRSILAYQREHQSEAAEVISIEPWSPGDITDDELKSVFTKHQLNKATRALKAGVVVELIRSNKPSARFHRLGHTIRFMVEGDARYVQCDCPDESPCFHAPLAVWVFREMKTDALSDLIDTFKDDHDDTKWLKESDENLRKLVGQGLGSVANAQIDRLAAFEKKLRAAGHLWLAEIFSDLRAQHEHYQAHDARFSPRVLSDCVGEAMIRHDALSNPELDIPKLFVRGQVEAKETAIGQSRLVGLGCRVQQFAHGVEIIAMLQDLSSGKLHGLTNYFPDQKVEGQAEPTFAELARKLVVHGRDFSSIGRSQLVVKTAKLGADHRLRLGRGTASTYAQNFEWEELRPPVGANGFAEIRSRLAVLPPASLRPRRVGEDFHACQIVSAEDVIFSERDQSVRAVLRDAHGDVAELIHPFSNRGASGTERLLNWLKNKPNAVRFVSGRMRLGPSGLVVHPTAVVFQGEQARKIVQPWVDDMDEWLETAEHTIDPKKFGKRSGLPALRESLADAVGDAILLGPEEGARLNSVWREIASFASELSTPIVADAANNILNTNGDAWVENVLRAAVVSRLAQELV